MLNRFLQERRRRMNNKDDTPRTSSTPGRVSSARKEKEESVGNIDFDDLDFDEQIGTGTFGNVWKGEYCGTPVAIKRFKEGPSTGLDSERLRKYIAREISVLRNLRHPNFVQFMGMCVHETGQFLVTEFVEGGDLFNFLVSNIDKVIPWKLRVSIAKDVATAMAFLHKQGVVHRDLKLENLLLTENHRVKICDLGLARVTEREQYMTIAGSDDYMAPEVFLGAKYDEKCDVFSYGVILGVLITLTRLPPRSRVHGFGFNPVALEERVPKDCPKEFTSLFLQCCKPRPDDRPSFRDALEKLKELAEELINTDDKIVPKEKSQEIVDVPHSDTLVTKEKPSTGNGDQQRRTTVILLASSDADVEEEALIAQLASPQAVEEKLPPEQHIQEPHPAPGPVAAVVAESNGEFDGSPNSRRILTNEHNRLSKRVHLRKNGE